MEVNLPVASINLNKGSMPIGPLQSKEFRGKPLNSLL